MKKNNRAEFAGFLYRLNNPTYQTLEVPVKEEEKPEANTEVLKEEDNAGTYPDIRDNLQRHDYQKTENSSDGSHNFERKIADLHHKTNVIPMSGKWKHTVTSGDQVLSHATGTGSSALNKRMQEIHEEKSEANTVLKEAKEKIELVSVRGCNSCQHMAHPKAFEKIVNNIGGGSGTSLVCPKCQSRNIESGMITKKQATDRGITEEKHWIAGAIKHPGALHKELGIPEGQKIPASKLNAAAHSSNPTERKRANLAKTLKHLKENFLNEEAELKQIMTGMHNIAKHFGYKPHALENNGSTHVLKHDKGHILKVTSHHDNEGAYASFQHQKNVKGKLQGDKDYHKVYGGNYPDFKTNNGHKGRSLWGYGGHALRATLNHVHGLNEGIEELLWEEKGTQHDHGPNFGKKVEGCKRCDELKGGSPARQAPWMKGRKSKAEQEAQRSEEIHKHFSDPDHDKKCGRMCTKFDW